jgi:hypothetical protein
MSEGPAVGPSPWTPSYEADPSAAVPVVPAATLDSTFELLITIMHPSKRVRTPNRKTKNMKPVSEDKGPFNVSVEIGWVAFLDVIAENLVVQRSDLIVTSLVWHWLKPASGPWLPVQDENGYKSMLKKIKTKVEPYVIVRMQPPIQKKVAGSSAGNAWDVEDELESDFEDRPVGKKVHILYLPILSHTQVLVGKAR